MFASSKAVVRLLQRTHAPAVTASTQLIGLRQCVFQRPNVSIIIARNNHAAVSEAMTAVEDLSENNEPSSSAAPQPSKQPVIDSLGRSYGTGRRKSSVARVWIKEGSGQFMVNDSRLIDYFQPIQREHILGSQLASNTAGLFDVWCTVKGGGISGQAGAIRLGIARALEAFDPQLRPCLSRAGMLTRDSRRVERKKPGQKKARKKFQWVKR